MLKLLRFFALLVPGAALAFLAGGHALLFVLALLAATGVSLWLDGDRPRFHWQQLGIGFGAGVRGTIPARAWGTHRNQLSYYPIRRIIPACARNTYP